MIELEKTYLLKELPEGIEKCRSKIVSDIYVPASIAHPILRIRQNGDKYEITKKSPIKDRDSSQQLEETIGLTKSEYESLAEVVGKKVSKIRYYYEWQEFIGEIDVFQDELVGLAMADFEFKSEEEMASFKMPPFCLVDVTQENFVAGGMLCGKKYKDIEPELEKFGYRKIG